jgi:glutathione synthase/RimK-type ligase-like ATP-grasp enzyme
MPKCAFLSILNTDGWFIDDDLVHEPLAHLGWEVVNIPWNQPANWDDYDMVVIRSPWDYQKHIAQFLSVLDDIEQSKATLLNSLDLVKWNINKNYLFELEKIGVELVPTLKHYSLKVQDIEQAFGHFDTEEVIVKPIIGANADDTYRIKKSNTGTFSQFEAVFQGKECMVQPFIQTIVDEGEFSLMYFNGKLSHTILKTVAKGDFRIQEEHGGGVTPIASPEPKLVAAAEKAMSCLPEKPFYARVDLVRTAQSSFALMELELIEPCLYFRFDAQSPIVFAENIDRYWKESIGFKLL